MKSPLQGTLACVTIAGCFWNTHEQETYQDE
jgi:hypothetical protein